MMGAMLDGLGPVKVPAPRPRPGPRPLAQIRADLDRAGERVDRLIVELDRIADELARGHGGAS